MSAESSSDPSGRLRYPRRERLKRRRLVRPLFRQGSSSVVRAGSGPVVLVGRLVRASQLPQGVRVQSGVAARRGLKGVDRNRARRLLRERHRLITLPLIRGFAEEELHHDLGLTLMIIYRGRNDRPGAAVMLDEHLADATRQLLDRLRTSVPELASPNNNT